MAIRKVRGSRQRKKTRDFYLFILPALLGFVIFTIYPMARSLWISFSDATLLYMDEAKFVSFTNYVNLLSGKDSYFWLSLRNTCLYAVVNVVGTLAIGLFAAILLTQKVKFLNGFRTIFYLPSLLPAVASALMFRWIFDPANGMVNTILRTIGVQNPPIWLESASTALITLVIISLYGFGGKMIIFISGLNDISSSYYEAADLDGANFWTKLTKITLPLLSPIFFYNLVMGTIGALQVFTEGFVISGAGPGNSTLFYVLRLYNIAYKAPFKLGYASAMAWILFVIVGIITIVYFALSKRWVFYESEGN